MWRTCRHFGIFRQAFYKWKRRFDEFGAAGLYDRPRAPHRSARATAREVVSKILYLRQHYHFGPGMIADYLKRFHQVSIAQSTVLTLRQNSRECRNRFGVMSRTTLPDAHVGARRDAEIRSALAGSTTAAGES